MKTNADKTQENKSRAVANTVSSKQSSGGTFQLVDNRPETVQLQKLQKMMANSPHAKKIAQFQAMMDNSKNPHHVQLRKMQEMLANSRLGKTAVLPGVVQKKGPLDEEELQLKSKEAVQKKGPLDEEELQLKAEEPVQKKDNNTGLPDNLKAGIENLSGYSMDDVHVHYHSDKPAQLQAHAYTQGTDIHIAPGQEKHLPHEAWHVVQQKQGRVQPTMQMAGGVPVNDDKGLEKEADGMGKEAVQRMKLQDDIHDSSRNQHRGLSPVIQRMLYIGGELISSGDIINQSQQPATLRDAFSTLPLEEKWRIQTVLREWALDNDSDQHKFKTWGEAIEATRNNAKFDHSDFYKKELNNDTIWQSNKDELIELLYLLFETYGMDIEKFTLTVSDKLGNARAQTHPAGDIPKEYSAYEEENIPLMVINSQLIISDLKEFPDGFSRAISTCRHEYKHVMNNMFSDQGSAGEAYDEVTAYTEAILNEVSNGKAPELSKADALDNYYKACSYYKILEGASEYEDSANTQLEKAEEKLKTYWSVTKEELDRYLVTREFT